MLRSIDPLSDSADAHCTANDTTLNVSPTADYRATGIAAATAGAAQGRTSMLAL